MKKSSTLQLLGRTVVILCAALIIVGAVLGQAQHGGNRRIRASRRSTCSDHSEPS